MIPDKGQGYLSRLSDSERQKIIAEYMPMIESIVKRYTSHAYRRISIEPADLLQEGALALVTSMQRYRPNAGTQFRTFAYRRITGAIIDFIRKQQIAPNSSGRRKRDITLVSNKYEQTYHRSPTREELAIELGLSDLKLKRILRSLHAAQPVMSLYDPLRFGRAARSVDRPEPAIDRLQNSCKTPEEYVVTSETTAEIRAALGKLSARSQQLIRSKYYEKRRSSHIAADFGLTVESLNRMNNETLGQLRGLLRPPA